MKTSRYDSLKLIFAIVLAIVFSAYLGSVQADEVAANISKVNGSITIATASAAGAVKTVNGSIQIQEGASATRVTTVNGGIEILDRSEVGSAETVNGGIRVGEDVRIKESLQTINGGIHTASGSSIGHRVGTVNGTIELADTLVDGDIETINGNIRLTGTSVVQGDIIVDKPRSKLWPSFSRYGSRHPELSIGPDVTVAGTIYLNREVELTIHESAHVGDIVHNY